MIKNTKANNKDIIYRHGCLVNITQDFLLLITLVFPSSHKKPRPNCGPKKANYHPSGWWFQLFFVTLRILTPRHLSTGGSNDSWGPTEVGNCLKFRFTMCVVFLVVVENPIHSLISTYTSYGTCSPPKLPTPTSQPFNCFFHGNPSDWITQRSTAKTQPNTNQHQHTHTHKNKHYHKTQPNKNQHQHNPHTKTNKQQLPQNTSHNKNNLPKSKKKHNNPHSHTKTTTKHNKP